MDSHSPIEDALMRGEVIQSSPQDELDPKISSMIQPRKFEDPIRIQISKPEQERQAFLRRISYELAVERGHVRR